LFYIKLKNMSAEKNLMALGLTLPQAPTPKGVYKPVLIDGKHCYISGQGPCLPSGELITGKLGKDLNEHQGKLAAEQVGLTILATLREYLGSLDKIKRVIKVLGMVNATADFEKHPFVINGCSELFAKVWGEDNGIGVRSAVGMGSLPNNIAVEIEALFELH
jgi:enamine deaminase RidA (YjgF/YER057c/UK114 family)